MAEGTMGKRVKGDDALVTEVRQARRTLRAWQQQRQAGEAEDWQVEIIRMNLHRAEQALDSYRLDVWERELRARRQYEVA
jgi:hypothetical protein